MKVAVVWNDGASGGRTAAEGVVGALREKGHETLLCEGDGNIVPALERFVARAPDGDPQALVFNMSQGVRGESRSSHVPALLEMAAMPYTGSGPLAHALALDRAVTKHLLRDAGLRTPPFHVMAQARDAPAGLAFPVVLKPLQAGSGVVQRIADPGALRGVAGAMQAVGAGALLAEEYVEGRPFSVIVLGNDEPRALPFVERAVAHQGTHACPARVDARLARQLRETAAAAFRACRCRDHARVDICLDSEGGAWVLGVHPGIELGFNASTVVAARAAGLSFTGLVERVLDAAHRRCFGKPLLQENDAPAAV